MKFQNLKTPKINWSNALTQRIYIYILWSKSHQFNKLFYILSGKEGCLSIPRRCGGGVAFTWASFFSPIFSPPCKLTRPQNAVALCCIYVSLRDWSWANRILRKPKTLLYKILPKTNSNCFFVLFMLYNSRIIKYAV